MYSPASKERSEGTEFNTPIRTLSPELKTYGFIIAIIVGMGGLAVGGAGVAGYFRVGVLSNMAQIDAIIMMAVGGGAGVIFLMVGIAGTMKNRQVSSVDTQGGLVYGPGVWPALGKKWGCKLKILDKPIPDPPEEDVVEGRVRIYIPKRVSVNGKAQDFTLNNLIKMAGGMTGGLFEYCADSSREHFGNSTASGWIEIDRGVIPESLSKDYTAQKEMVEGMGCHMPSILEAVVLNLMVFAFTGERLYGKEPVAVYTRCSEVVWAGYPVVVGGFGPKGLSIYAASSSSTSHGVAAVKRF